MAIVYNWDFGDGTSSSDETPTHEYSFPGRYTVTLTVWDDTDGMRNLIIKVLYIYVYTVEQIPRKTNKCFGYYVNAETDEE
jgi:PKD repeat protein